jgi:hypothetical protein
MHAVEAIAVSTMTSAAGISLMLIAYYGAAI